MIDFLRGDNGFCLGPESGSAAFVQRNELLDIYHRRFKRGGPMRPSSRLQTNILRSVLVVSISFLFLWLAARSQNWRHAFQFTGPANGYYHLLAEGLRDGHTYAKADVHPGLLSPDPTVRANSPFLLDLSLYRGRYYLYFGVFPAMAVFLPYLVLTGGHLDEGMATVGLVFLGMAFQLSLFHRMRRRYFAGISRGLEVVCTLFLILGSGVPSLVFAGGSYEVAVAGAYATGSFGLWAFYQALHARRATGYFLALSCLGFALSVGSRPTTLLALPVFFGASVWLLRRNSTQPDPQRERTWIVACLRFSVLPAVLIGLGLAGYNYARFGSPLEFGFKYQLNAMMGDHFPLAKWSFFWPNLKWYYLTPPVISPYFPFSFPINASVRPVGYYGYEVVHGQWLSLVAAGFCLVGVIALRARQQSTPPALRMMIVTALGCFVFLFLGLGFFGARADRYVVDFHTSLVLAITLVAAYTASTLPRNPGTLLGKLGFGIVAFLAASLSLLSSMQTLRRTAMLHPQAFQTLSFYGNYPSYLLQKAGVYHYGPFQLQVKFPRVDTPSLQPLVSTGVPSEVDQLMAMVYPGNQLKLVFSHQGYPTVETKLITYDSTSEYTVKLEMGSLYPPKHHPFFATWEANDVDLLKTRLKVSLNGRPVLTTAAQFYDAPPSRIYFGENREGDGSRFEGKIFDVRRLPIPGAAELHTAPLGAWRLVLSLPRPDQLAAQPLLASGKTGAGNLLFLQLTNETTARFGFDQWGFAFNQSPPINFSASDSHVVEVFVGCTAAKYPWLPEDEMPREELQRSAAVLRVWVDGKPVWATRILGNQDSYQMTSIGLNTQGFSSALASYLGLIAAGDWTEQEAAAFVRKNLSEPAPE